MGEYLCFVCCADDPCVLDTGDSGTGKPFVCPLDINVPEWEKQSESEG